MWNRKPIMTNSKKQEINCSNRDVTADTLATFSPMTTTPEETTTTSPVPATEAPAVEVAKTESTPAAAPVTNPFASLLANSSSAAQAKKDENEEEGDDDDVSIFKHELFANHF